MLHGKMLFIFYNTFGVANNGSCGGKLRRITMKYKGIEEKNNSMVFDGCPVHLLYCLLTDYYYYYCTAVAPATKSSP